MGSERVGVIGAGVMGSEIAQVAAAAGLETVLVDVDVSAVERGVAHIRDIGARRVAKGRMTEVDAASLLERITIATDIGALTGCDVVIEAAPEVMDLKLAIWREIDAAAPPGAVLASNTSGLSITELAAETARPDAVLGLHFFNPASVMRLVEVIRGAETSDQTVAAGVALAQTLGKTPVTVRECPGFLVNRILVRAMVEAYRHADETGAVRHGADRAVVDAGPAPMGPFALGDLVGLDTMLHVQRDLERAYGDRFASGTSLAGEVAAGRLGQKSGAGLVAGRQEAEPDEHGAAVAERYYMGALDEACRCLDEGIGALADVDLAMRLGAGWASGPLEWADEQGLALMATRLAALTATAGERFRPKPPLDHRVASGTTFTSTPKEA